MTIVLYHFFLQTKIRVEHLPDILLHCLLFHKRCRWTVKSKLPTTENWLRKLYQYSKKNYKSTEDKHETNHINSKYNDTNTDTRKMHNTWACTESAWSSSHFDVGSHALRGSSSESRHVIHVHLRLSLSSPLSLSTSICLSPSSSSSSLSCTSSSTLSSTTWSPCKTCAPPRTRGVTTPTTSTPPSHEHRKNRILLVIFGVSHNLYRTFYFALSRNVVPSAHHRFCPSFCNFEKFWSILIFAPMHRYTQDFRKIYPRRNTESVKT